MASLRASLCLLLVSFSESSLCSLGWRKLKQRSSISAFMAHRPRRLARGANSLMDSSANLSCFSAGRNSRVLKLWRRSASFMRTTLGSLMAWTIPRRESTWKEDTVQVPFSLNSWLYSLSLLTCRLGGIQKGQKGNQGGSKGGFGQRLTPWTRERMSWPKRVSRVDSSIKVSSRTSCKRPAATTSPVQPHWERIIAVSRQWLKYTLPSFLTCTQNTRPRFRNASLLKMRESSRGFKKIFVIAESKE